MYRDMFEVLGEIDTNGRDRKNYTRTAYAFARAEDKDLHTTPYLGCSPE
jgi:hypothetical protein